MTADHTIIHWTILPRGVRNGTFFFSALVSFEFKAGDEHDTKELLKAWPEIIQRLRFNVVTANKPSQQVGLDGGDMIDVCVDRITPESCSLDWKKYLGLDEADAYITEAPTKKSSVVPVSPFRTLAPERANTTRSAESIRETLKRAYGTRDLSPQKHGEHPLNMFRVRVGSMPKPLEDLVVRIQETDPWRARELDRLTHNRREHLLEKYSELHEKDGVRFRTPKGGDAFGDDLITSVERYVQRVPPPIHRPGHVVAMDHRVWLQCQAPLELRPGDLIARVSETQQLEISWNLSETGNASPSSHANHLSLVIEKKQTVQLSSMVRSTGNVAILELASWFIQRNLDLEISFSEQPPQAVSGERGITLLRYWYNSQTSRLFRSTVDAVGKLTPWRPVNGDDVASRIDALRDYAQVMRSCGLCFDLRCSAERLPAGVAVAVQPVIDSLPESIPETVKEIFSCKLRHSLTLVSLGSNGLTADEFAPDSYPAGGMYLRSSDIRVRTLNEEAAIHSLIRMVEDLATRMGWCFIIKKDGEDGIIQSTKTHLNLVGEQVKLVWPKYQPAEGFTLKKSGLEMKSITKIADRVPLLVNLPFVELMTSLSNLRVGDTTESATNDNAENEIAGRLQRIKATCRISTDDEGVVVQLVRLHDKTGRWEVPGRYSRTEIERPQLPSLTSDGLSVIPTSRAVVEALWSSSTKLINSRQRAEPLKRGDLLGGFEVLVRKSGDGVTGSCWRSMTGIKLTSRECENERFVPIRAATLHATDGTSEQVRQGRVPPESYVPPALATFHGRNLAATSIPQLGDQSLSWVAQAVPELRFGTQYEVAVRLLDKSLASVVDESCSVLGVRDPSEDEIVTSTCLRWESVAPPVVMLDEPWSQTTHPGRTLLRMVVRGDQPRDVRRIVPPRVHRDFALRHGVFDEALREYRNNPKNGVNELAKLVHGMTELSVNGQASTPSEAKAKAADAEASGPGWTIRSLKACGKTSHDLEPLLEFNSNAALLDSPVYVKSHPDDDSFREGWLPDPLAHGVIADVVDEAGERWLEGESVRAPWYPNGGRWPDAKPLRIVTKASASAKKPRMRYDAASRSLVVLLPRAFVGSIRLRSECSENVERLLGLCAPEKINGFGLERDNRHVTPALDVACAFALPQPVASPCIDAIHHRQDNASLGGLAAFFGVNLTSLVNDSGDKATTTEVLPLSDAIKDSEARVCLHRSSTGSVTILRKWFKAAVKHGRVSWQEHHGVVDTYDVAPRDTVRSSRNVGLTPMDCLFFSGSHDAYRYLYQYWCEAHSRFSSDFPRTDNNKLPLPSAMFFDEQRAVLPPPEVRAEYILPLIGWIQQHDDERNVYVSTCQRRSLRVFLSGEPCVTGPGECIGVVFGPGSADTANEGASQWAADPVTVDARHTMSRQIPVRANDEAVTGMPDPQEFYPSEPAAIGEVMERDQQALRELKRTRGIHTAYPKFDPEHNKWYVDVHLPAPPQPDVFSTLSLVRVQPGHALAKTSNTTNECMSAARTTPTDLMVSRPFQTDFALIASDRVVQVSRVKGDRGIRVVVSGRMPPPARSSELGSTIRIDLCEPVFDQVGTVMGWSVCHCPDVDSADSSASIVRHVERVTNPDIANVERQDIVLATEFHWRRKTSRRRLVVTEVQAAGDQERVVYCDILDL
jgi:hypothetical protein